MRLRTEAKRAGLIGFTLTTLVALPACEESNLAACTPTTTDATAAQKVSVQRAGVLEARLTADNAALGGKPLSFDVLEGGNSLYHAEASTGADGRASVDLKRVEVASLTALARADTWRA